MLVGHIILCYVISSYVKGTGLQRSTPVKADGTMERSVSPSTVKPKRPGHVNEYFATIAGDRNATKDV